MQTQGFFTSYQPSQQNPISLQYCATSFTQRRQAMHSCPDLPSFSLHKHSKSKLSISRAMLTDKSRQSIRCLASSNYGLQGWSKLGNTPIHDAVNDVSEKKILLYLQQFSSLSEQLPSWPVRPMWIQSIESFSKEESSSKADIGTFLNKQLNTSNMTELLINHTEVFKYLAHLLRLDGNVIGNIESTSWHPYNMSIQHCCWLISLLIHEQEKNIDIPQNISRTALRLFMYRELFCILQLMQATRHILLADKLSYAAKNHYASFQAKLWSHQCISLPSHQEYIIPAIANNHVLYFSFRKYRVGNALQCTFRLDNLGEGSDTNHQRQNESTMIYPVHFSCDFKTLKSSNGRLFFENFLDHFITKDRHNDLSHTYTLFEQLKKNIQSITTIKRTNIADQPQEMLLHLPQLVHNCSFENYNAGILARSVGFFAKEMEPSAAIAQGYSLFQTMHTMAIDMTIKRIFSYVLTPNYFFKNYTQKQSELLEQQVTLALQSKPNYLSHLFMQPYNQTLGNHLNPKQLMEIVTSGRTDLLRIILPYVNNQEKLFHQKDIHGNTLLHLVVSNYDKIVELDWLLEILMKQGLHPHTPNAQGDTPLIQALIGRAWPIVRWFHQKGYMDQYLTNRSSNALTDFPVRSELIQLLNNSL